MQSLSVFCEGVYLNDLIAYFNLSKRLGQDELMQIGEFLDDMRAVDAAPSVARMARRAARSAIRQHIDDGKHAVIADICGRSWALNDEWQRELRKREMTA